MPDEPRDRDAGRSGYSPRHAGDQDAEPRRRRRRSMEDSGGVSVSDLVRRHTGRALPAQPRPDERPQRRQPEPEDPSPQAPPPAARPEPRKPQRVTPPDESPRQRPAPRGRPAPDTPPGPPAPRRGTNTPPPAGSNPAHAAEPSRPDAPAPRGPRTRGMSEQAPTGGHMPAPPPRTEQRRQPTRQGITRPPTAPGTRGAQPGGPQPHRAPRPPQPRPAPQNGYAPQSGQPRPETPAREAQTQRRPPAEPGTANLPGAPEPGRRPQRTAAPGGDPNTAGTPGGDERKPYEEIDAASLTAEIEAIDATIQHKHRVDKTLARFSAVHDEIAEEEKKRRERKSRFLPWVTPDEEMEEALSSASLPVVARTSAGGDEEPPGAPDGPQVRDGGEPPEPPTGQSARRRLGGLAAKVAAVVIATLVFVATGVGWGAKTWVNGKIDFVAALDQNSSDIRNAAGQLGDENFLLVGSDTRIGQSKNDNAGTVADAGGARADTVMVAHIPQNRSRVIVVSFPRDLEVQRPACRRWNPHTGGYGDKTVPAAAHVKLNSVYAVGGPKCLVDVVQRLSGLQINHFAGINFNGFKAMVDAVNGVRVCSTIPIVDTKLGTVLAKPGPQVISGTQALNYVRARHVKGDPTSGYGRMQRQQRFLSSLLRKVLSQDVLLNPGKLTSFVSAFAQATRGENVGVDELLTLARSMRGMQSGDVTFVTVPTTGTANQRGNEVLRPAENRALFDAVINGTPLPGEKGSRPTSQASPPPQHVDPKSVKIQVLNAGNTTTGIAGDTADALAKQGFQVMQTQNAPTKVPHTEIRYAADATNKAKALAAAVPGARLTKDPAAEGAVILMIGPDFQGLGKSGDAGSGSPAAAKPAPKAMPKLSTVNAADTTCPRL